VAPSCPPACLRLVVLREHRSQEAGWADGVSQARSLSPDVVTATHHTRPARPPPAAGLKVRAGHGAGRECPGLTLPGVPVTCARHGRPGSAPGLAPSTHPERAPRPAPGQTTVPIPCRWDASGGQSWQAAAALHGRESESKLELA